MLKLVMDKKTLKRIVAFGASTCEGKVDVEYGGFVSRLRTWMESIRPYNAVYNLGISGNITEQLLARIEQEAIPRKPDLIILQCGLNDFMRKGQIDAPTQSSLDQLTSNIKAIITKAKTISDVLLVSVFPIDESKTTPFHNKDWYYTLADAQIHANLTKAISIEKEIPYIDIFSEFSKVDYKKHLLFTDGLHANAKGHELIFNQIKDYLARNYRLPSP
jgi:lysophospholipase L1-like esterase